MAVGRARRKKGGDVGVGHGLTPALAGILPAIEDEESEEYQPKISTIHLYR